ncbi:MAG: hypothetical protein QNJ65_20210, partial [Xenococcaceae cyanobacterium MO_234.B1]|nr:hypothetical protein [Xenococcaceae cyanobacterium MO_234.B1]
ISKTWKHLPDKPFRLFTITEYMTNDPLVQLGENNPPVFIPPSPSASRPLSLSSKLELVENFCCPALEGCINFDSTEPVM